jgi:hypothetical protein
VLAPLETAESVLKRENREIGAEIDAFETFGERVGSITQVTDG